MIIFFCIIIFLLELALILYLIDKIIKVHKFSLKDTAVYSGVVLLTALTLIMALIKIYPEKTLLSKIFTAIKEGVYIVALSINTDIVNELASAGDLTSKFLLASYITEYAMSALALLSITITLLFVYFKNSIRRFINCVFKRNQKEINYVLGYNDDSKEYIKNYYLDFLKDKKKTSHQMMAVLDGSTLGKHEDQKLFLNSYKVPFKTKKYSETTDIEKTISSLTNIKRYNKYRFIVFITEDKKLFDIVEVALKLIKEGAFDNKDVKFIVVANVEQERYLNNMINKNKDDRRIIGAQIDERGPDVVDDSKGHIKVLNKYDLISSEFVRNHNFAKYFPKEYINSDLTIKDVDINLYVFGFGKVNQAVLRDALICNQFVKKVPCNGKYKLAPVRMNVRVYDSNSRIECFDLINGIYKYDKKPYVRNPRKYLDPTDDYISYRVFYPDTSIFENDFVKRIFDEINSKAIHKPQINYFIISLDSDFENSDVAVKMRNNINHIVNTNNYYFIRVKDSRYDVKNKINGFGSNKDVLRYDNVVGSHIEEIANKYSDELNKNDVDYAKWAKLTPIKVKSSLYTVYSLYFNLSLLMLLNKEKEASIELLKELFKDNYVINEKSYDDFNQIVDMQDIDKYEFYDELIKENDKFSIRDVFAFIGHEQWNALEMSQGALPMSKDYAEQVAIDKNVIEHKTVDELYHLAMTSSYGLKQFYFYLSNLRIQKGKKESVRADIVKYDYKSMDLISLDVQGDCRMKELYDELMDFLNNEN